MSYNGSGTFQINSTGQPVVTMTTITSTAFNALTADLGTGLSTAICKDGQTTTTAQIPFALGISVPGSGSVNLNCPLISTYDGDSQFPFLLASGDMGTTGYFKSTGFGFTATFDTTGITTDNGSGFDVVCVSGGVTLSNGATSWAAISDENHKTDWIPIPPEGALARVASWRAGTYRYKWEDGETPRRVGLIAQDVGKDRPEAVEMSQGGMLMLRLAETIPDLVAALAEAKARIEALEAKCL